MGSPHVRAHASPRLGDTKPTRAPALVLALGIALLAQSLLLVSCAAPQPVMSLARPGQPAANHDGSSSDRCLVRTAPDPALVFFTESAETTADVPSIIFAVLGYRGPGTYQPHLVDRQHPYGSNVFTWSLHRWTAFFNFVTVVVSRADAHTISGTVTGQLYDLVQRGASPSPAHLSGGWSCAVGDATPSVMPPTTLTERYAGAEFSFQYPRGWVVEPSNATLPASTGAVVAYLAAQPLETPCLVRPNSEYCNLPLTALRPDSVLIGWFTGFLPPGPQQPADASPFASAAGTGWISVDRDACLAQLGSEELIAVVPSIQLRMTACVRGPDVGSLEQVARSVMASTTMTG